MKRISCLIMFVLCIVYGGWYLYPYISYQLFYHSSIEFKKSMAKEVNVFDEVSPSPTDWESINIGGLSLKVPLNNLNNVYGAENRIHFVGKFGKISIVDITSNREKESLLVDYFDQKRIYKSNPMDLGFFRSREVNDRAKKNQVLKCMSVINLNILEINIVPPTVLKAIYIKMFNERNKCYVGVVDVYNDNGKKMFTIFLYSNKVEGLDKIFSQLIGSIKFHNSFFDVEVVEKDIKNLIEMYGR